MVARANWLRNVTSKVLPEAKQRKVLCPASHYSSSVAERAPQLTAHGTFEMSLSFATTMILKHRVVKIGAGAKPSTMFPSETVAEI